MNKRIETKSRINKQFTCRKKKEKKRAKANFAKES